MTVFLDDHSFFDHLYNSYIFYMSYIIRISREKDIINRARLNSNVLIYSSMSRRQRARLNAKPSMFCWSDPACRSSRSVPLQ